MKTLLIILFLIGVITMPYYCGANEVNFEKYSSIDEQLNITMEYPSGWNFKERRGAYNSFTTVRFLEPKQTNKHSSSISLTAQNITKTNISPQTVNALTDDILKKRFEFKETKVISNEEINILDTIGRDITISYLRIKNLYSMDRELELIQERIIIFMKNDNFYTLNYISPAEDFETFNDAFTHMIQSLKFKNT